MKKVFFGLLILAAGTSIYFLMRKQNKLNDAHNSKHDWILGQWKLDSIRVSGDSTGQFMVGIMGMVDSNLLNYHYEFQKNGIIKTTLSDSLVQDSVRYEWNKQDQLVWKEYPSDTTGEAFTVLLPHPNSLVLQSQDSTSLMFSKQTK